MLDTIDAIMDRLYADATLMALLGGATAIGNWEVPAGTSYPIVLVNEVAETMVYNFSAVAWVPGVVDIVAIVKEANGVSQSPQTKLKNIQARIYALLQDAESSLSLGSGRCINMRRIRLMPGNGPTTISSGERYWRLGYSWSCDTSP